MKDLEFNKISAAILIAGILAMVSGKITDVIYSPETKLATRGYEIEVAEEDNSGKVVKKEEVIIENFFKTADLNKGKKISKKCLSCHSIEKNGKHKVGPALWGIVGYKIAARDYPYSSALKSINRVWNYEELYHFLNKPKKYAPGTKMSFAGLRKPQDVVDLIVYLNENSDNKIELPK